MADNDKPYEGPERRKENRRKQPERRVLVRFEPDKEPRRKNKGRRDGDRDIWHRRDL